MPLIIREEVFDGTWLGVWHISEPSEYFRARVILLGGEETSLMKLPAQRQHQWLASRYLLKVVLDETAPFETASHATGKPYLVGRPEEISLSHSEDYVAVMIGRQEVGVDIQICKEKILRLEHKFARPEESTCLDRGDLLRHLHILWGAKEALYKIHARKQLHFLKHLHVDLPSQIKERDMFSGKIDTGTGEISCTLCYRLLDNYVLVYGQRK